MKKFFTVVPLQQRLNKYYYEPVDNTRLDFGEKTAFPILTAINGYVRDGEKFTVIAPTVKNEAGARNSQALREELESLAAKKGCEFTLELPEYEESSGIGAMTDIFRRLIEFTEDGDEMFSCMTYGSKPISLAIQMAIQYAYRVRKNVTIDCIVYGEIRRGGEPDRAYVYDETALVKLDEVVHALAERRVENPAAVIDAILGL